MFDIFKKEIKVSDKVKLYLTSGREVEVEIIEIGDNYILVINSDGTQSRVFETLIGGWDLIPVKNQREPLTENIIEKKPESNEIKQVSIDSIPKINTEPRKKIGLTIVGKIDLDKIEPKRKIPAEIKTAVEPPVFQERLPQSLSQHIKEHNLVFNSLRNLKQLKDIITSDVSKQTIPANAIIKRYGQNSYGSKFGFLTDNEKRDYYFSITDVNDDKLKDILNKHNPQGTHVVCSLKSIQGKLRATSIYLPKKVEDFQSIAESHYKNKEFLETLSILDLIISSNNDFEPAIELKNKILTNLNKRKITPSVAANIFIQAKHEIKKGNTENGKRLLLELIETPNFKSENAVKELAYELQREGDIDEAIQTTLKYQKLIKSSDPNSLVAYFYETKKDFGNAISYLKNVKPLTSIEKIRVEKRLAICYFQIQNYEESEVYLKKVLNKLPNDNIIQRQLELLEKVKSEGLSDEIETIFNEAELSSLTGGRSPHIQFALSNCDYTGVPTAIVSEEKFTKTTLQSLRRLIEDAGKARPRERAPYLLTEAKLMEVLEPAREDELGSVLSRYCLAMGQNASSENNPVDIVRFYLLEAFRLAKNYDTISGFVPIYLYSFRLSSFESYQNLSKALDSTLKDIFENEINIGFWNGIIDLFLTNTEIFSQLLTRLYQNQSYQNSCVTFLSNYLGIDKINIPSKESFSNLWNEAVDKRRREKETFSSKFNSLGKNKTTDSFSEAFNSAKNSIPTWISILDRHRINYIDDIFRTLIEFNTQSAFEDKERYFNIVGSQINTLLSEIEVSPTEFSFNILRSQLAILSKLVENEFKTVIQTSKPITSIKVLGESIIHDNNLVSASINISNKKGSVYIPDECYPLIPVNVTPQFRRSLPPSI